MLHLILKVNPFRFIVRLTYEIEQLFSVIVSPDENYLLYQLLTEDKKNLTTHVLDLKTKAKTEILRFAYEEGNFLYEFNINISRRKEMHPNILSRQQTFDLFEM